MEDSFEVLKKYKIIAVVGMSRNPNKPSHFVPEYLKNNGYTIIPVNPAAEGEILGEKVYANLREIPQKVEIVVIFRLPKDIPPIVEDAIDIGAKVIWMQEGIVNESAAQRAKNAGLTVIMDKCMMKIHQTFKKQL